MIVYIDSIKSRKASPKNINYVINKLKEIYPNLETYSFDEMNKINKEDVDILLFSGGDGSFNKIINYFHDYLDNITFGYIPMGTANDIGRNLNIKSIDDAINIIKEGQTKEESILEVNDKLFMYAISVGEMSGVSTNASHDKKKHYGKTVYKLIGIKYLFKKKNDIIINGKKEKLKVLIIARTKYLGGVKVRRLFDNNLYLYKIRNVFDIIALFIFGRFKSKHGELISNIHIESNSIWCIDGEKIDIEKGNVEISNKKIKMLSKNA